MSGAAALHAHEHLAEAVALALASTGCYAASAVFQQREAARSSTGGLALFRTLARRPSWWFAVLATVAGAGLHVVALAVGPLSVVQPISVLTLVWALPMGAAFAKRVVTAREWRAAAVVVVGVSLALAVLPHRSGRAQLTVGMLLATLVAIVVLVAVLTGAARWLTASRRAGRAVRWGPVLVASAAATCSGFASAMGRIAFSGAAPFLAAAAIAVVAAGAGLALSQPAYRRGGLGAPLATLILVDPLVAVGIAVTLLAEPVSLTPMTAALGLVGVAATAGGIGALARRRPSPAAERATP
jgi:hypothetical protein